MGDGYDEIAAAAGRAAMELPMVTAQAAAQIIGSAGDLASAKSAVGQLAHPHYRSLVTAFLDCCLMASTQASPTSVALALLTAAHSEKVHRESQSTELVWTGPHTAVVPLRRTEQAVLQVLDSAAKRITLVSYAVYRIPNVRGALVRAAMRGVRINVIIETPDRIEGEGEYNTLKALGEDVASCCAVYYWPAEQRAKADGGKVGILHVKCAVADAQWLFLSSANLTEYAFDINMELGVLVSGGKMPSQVEQNFDRLIATSVLERV